MRGLSMGKKFVLLEVVHSTILYGASIWYTGYGLQDGVCLSAPGYRSVPPVKLLIQDGRNGKPGINGKVAEDQERDRAQRAKDLIPDLGKWGACGDKEGIDYFICQFLPGHRSFRTYTKRIGKERTESCMYCSQEDTPDHTVFWYPERDRERVPMM